MNIKDYISNKNQLCHVTKFTYTEGTAKGTSAIRINNGIGLDFIILPDRGMDIGELYFKGRLISFIAEPGIVNPMFFLERDDEWLRSFGGGFLVTCGLTQVGEPCDFNGKHYGLHGRISNSPAAEVGYRNKIIDDIGYVDMWGEIAQTKHQSENITLTRKISINSKENILHITDQITNMGADRQPLMMLYHYNFGYPFLNPNFHIEADIINSIGVDDYSNTNLTAYNDFYEPGSDDGELTFLHELKTGEIKLVGRQAIISIKYNLDNLPFLGQWKHLKKRAYVLGIEPCNNHIKGIAYEHQQKTLKYIEPDEVITNCFEIIFYGD